MLLHTLDLVDGAGTRHDVWRPGVYFNGRQYNRLSASMVNARKPHFFNERAGGFIANPRVLTPEGVRCAWSSDSGTIGMADGCSGCRCACGNGVWQCCGYCWWGADDMASMMAMHESGDAYNEGCAQEECDYNEVVLDGPWWTAHLPFVIEAMFIGPADGTGADGCYGNACVNSMRDIHSDFLREFGITAEQVPLVYYDIGSGFRLA